ncbi:MAG TPA: CHRD domain-containing protein [Acetobacteraceae bacterium]|nr:CHRD domain-containing protein [Acetobacteraceae bacterium]
MRPTRIWSVLLALALFGWITSATLAHSAPVSFSVPLSGAAQVPPVSTPGTGTADLTYDPTTRLLTWSITFSGLSSPATMAHFHGPAAAGKNAGVQIWISKRGAAPTSPMTGSATLTPEQATMLMDDEFYINVHSQDHPAGEIRGQVVPPKS